MFCSLQFAQYLYSSLLFIDIRRNTDNSEIFNMHLIGVDDNVLSPDKP